MNLSELIQAFETGTLEKAELIRLANAIHGRLFDYPEVLARSDITEIRIDEAGVAFHVAKPDLWLRCPSGEARVAPVEMLNFHSYEAEETRIMLAALTDGMVIFDVGANIGWYSMLFARHFHRARIHAFEPLPYFNEFLELNVRANGLGENVAVHCVGLSNEHRTVDLHFDPGNATNASLRNVAHSETARPAAVEVTELDAWCKEHGVQPDFIKCDVEGAELLVMQGARRLLADAPPVIFLEMLRKWTKPYDYHPNDLISLMSGFGYVCNGISRQGMRPVPSVDDSTKETNYLFVHPRAHADLFNRLGVTQQWIP